MSISAKGEIDDPVRRAHFGAVFFEAFLTDIQGPKGPTMLKEYHEKAKEVAKELGIRALNVLKTEQEKDEVAGRLKFVGGHLHMLDGCAKASQTTVGSCRIDGLKHMAFIEAELKGLEYSLDTYTPAEAA